MVREAERLTASWEGYRRDNRRLFARTRLLNTRTTSPSATVSRRPDATAEAATACASTPAAILSEIMRLASVCARVPPGGKSHRPKRNHTLCFESKLHCFEDQGKPRIEHGIVLLRWGFAIYWP